MLKLPLFASALFCLLFATSARAADNPKDVVKAAAEQLAQKANYSWKTTVDGGAGGMRNGVTEGKTEKGGYTTLAVTRQDVTTDAVLKGATGEVGAIKIEDEWQTIADLTKDDGTGGFDPGRFTALLISMVKAPAAEATGLADSAKSLAKADDGAWAGDLTEEGAKALMMFRLPGAEPPAITSPKGTVKFWLKDGGLDKYEFNVQGSIDFNGNAIDINRTTTVEIKDVGTTKVAAIEAAVKKIQMAGTATRPATRPGGV